MARPRQVSKDAAAAAVAEAGARGNFDAVVLAPIDPSVTQRIAIALDLQPQKSSKRQGQRSAQAQQQARGLDALQLSDPYYEQPLHREKLQRLLMAMAKWKRGIGYDKCLAQFCAAVLARLDSERQAFKAVARVYMHYQLDDYYLQQGRAVRGAALLQDVDEVWKGVEMLWPDITAVFRRLGRKDLFVEVAESWLRSLMSASCSSSKATHMDMELLLENVMEVDRPRPGCTRGLLILVATRAFGRHYDDLVYARTPEHLASSVNNFRHHIALDGLLLLLLNTEPSLVACRAFEVATLLPTFCPVGWIAGSGAACWALQVKAAAYTAPVLPYVVLAWGTAGMIVGSLVAAIVGVASGTHFLHTTMRSWVSRQPVLPTTHPRADVADGASASSSSSSSSASAACSTAPPNAKAAEGTRRPCRACGVMGALELPNFAWW